MSVLWSFVTVTVVPLALAFVVNHLAPEVAKKIAERMTGPISDSFVKWFRARFPSLGGWLFRENPDAVADAAAASEEAVWYYAAAGERHGPVTATALRNMYTTGELHSDGMVWRSKMDTWATLESIQHELPARPKVRVGRPPKRFTVGPGGVAIGLFVAFFVVLLIAVVGANLALSGAR